MNTAITNANSSDNRYCVFRMRQDIFDGNYFIGFMATKFDGIRGNYREIEKDCSAHDNEEECLEDDDCNWNNIICENKINSYSVNETSKTSTYSIVSGLERIKFKDFLQDTNSSVIWPSLSILVFACAFN